MLTIEELRLAHDATKVTVIMVNPLTMGVPRRQPHRRQA